jgi:(R,R)-butanediol dehydrogenase/meso-butanediol dehydrogenase/diacetyl reductase
MAGEVDAVGDGVEGWRGGERVAVEPVRSCGHCATCRRGIDVVCAEAELYGIHRDGGFAEYVTLPAGRLFRVPDDLEPRIAALSEPMAVMVHGLRRGQLSEGQRVLVLGAGSVGLVGVLAARGLGAGEVWITARHDHQAGAATRLGASRVLREEEATLESLAALGRETPIDLVVETVGGRADTLRLAGAAVRPTGIISVVGLFMGPITLDGLSLFLKENTLAFSNCYTHPHEGADFETAVELVSANRDLLGAVASHEMPLEDVSRAFALASEKKSGVVKVTVRP